MKRTFKKVAQYGNANWKGDFTELELLAIVNGYLAEFEYSNEQGIPSPTMRGMCDVLMEDASNGIKEAKELLVEILARAKWSL